MRWQQTEFLFKGIYLGLLLFIGLVLQQPDWWRELAQVAVCTFGVLALFLAAAGLRKLREGAEVKGRWGAFLLFVILENPGMVYAGVLLGMLLGAYTLLANYSFFGATAVREEEFERFRLLYCVLGGMAVGVLFNVLYSLNSLRLRQWVGLAMGAGLVVATIYLLPQIMPDRQMRVMFATLLLLGIPLFYLLTLASMTEETEVEIMAICAALGVSLWILSEVWFEGNTNVQFALLTIPAAVYYLYTRRILPGLRVFKHVLRGISFANVGEIRPALVSLGRALYLDPNNALAREQLWNVHRLMDFDKVEGDPPTLALLNFELCLERVATLLLATKVRPEGLGESHRLLNLVDRQREEMRPRVDYWRAIAFAHERKYDEAAAALTRVLTGEGTAHGNPHRRHILFQAWQLALMLHPELERRVGQPLLAMPGRRMQALHAAERRAAQNPEDKAAVDLKRLLYSELTPAEFATQVVDGKAPDWVDYAYLQQLGLAMVAEEERWQRGCDFLSIAALGLPAQSPTLYTTMAKAYEKAGNFAEVWRCYEEAKKAGKAYGPANLGTEDRHTYFAIVKALGEDAAKRGDNAAAIENFRLFADYERAGANTYRTLAELHERNGEAWLALHATEHGLVHDKTDADLLARRDRYYYSVQPAEVKTHWEQIQKWFDVAYCKTKAKQLIDQHGEDLELLDWGSHLAELAQAAEPNSMVVKLLRARVERRRGENDRAIAILEEIRAAKPERFDSNEEEEAWYSACRMLGDLYLHTRPDQALLCLQDYRKFGKSGADTVYKMGVAYENMGDGVRAAKCYETVAAYDSHPLAHEANMALHRLRATPQA